jgi:DNA-binding PadR family transcriptional regulator
MSSDKQLTPFSYAVMALVGKGGAGPHDLARMMREGEVFWAAARSQWYAEPKRLERLGYLKSAKQPGQTTERTHYTLTAAGTRALKKWLAEPARYTRVQSEPVIKLLAADFVDDSVILESLRALRGRLAEMREDLAQAEGRRGEYPHRERYLKLNHEFARALLETHERWLDEVDRELGGKRQTG